MVLESLPHDESDEAATAMQKIPAMIFLNIDFSPFDQRTKTELVRRQD
jgi:hypothetical protein